MTDALETIVEAARAGDKDALTSVVKEVQDMVHHLAMRILVNPEDAREATQEILIVIVTKLAGFDGKSALKTWVYRVAANYLISAKRVHDRDPGLTFDAFREDLHEGLVGDPRPSAEDTVMLNELRVSCTMAMLLCLDLPHRLAYVLGDIMEFDHREAAEVLSIAPANFRKRLSRARADVVSFTSRHCGLASDAARCSCPRRLPRALKLGRVDPRNPFFSTDGPTYEQVLKKVTSIEAGLKTLVLQQATPPFASPTDFGAKIAQIVATA